MELKTEKVLICFTCHTYYFRFRRQELNSLASILNIPHNVLWNHDTTYLNNLNLKDHIIKSSIAYSEQDASLGNDYDVFVTINLPTEHKESIAKFLIQRSILIKAVVDLWGTGSNYLELKNNLESSHDSRITQYITPEKTFCFLVDAFGKHLTHEEQLDKMNQFSFLFSGNERANLKSPDVTLGIFEHWSRSNHSTSSQLQQIFFGRVMAQRNNTPLPWWWKYRLTVRPILGPTTMDNELAFLMVNQGLVRQGTIVFDPFCGTGGLLISASHFGALCFGSDIDSRVLKGWGVSQHNTNCQQDKKKAESSKLPPDIFRNFKTYKLSRPDIIRSDVAGWTRLKHQDDTKQWGCACRPWVDAIITDPPYGVRATVREVATKKNNVTHMETDDSNTTDVPLKCSLYPSTMVSSVDVVIQDLLDLSAKLLVTGGRLVFFLPVISSQTVQTLQELSHKDLKLEAASLQELSAGLGRVLVTMSRLPRNEQVV